MAIRLLGTPKPTIWLVSLSFFDSGVSEVAVAQKPSVRDVPPYCSNRGVPVHKIAEKVDDLLSKCDDSDVASLQTEVSTTKQNNPWLT